MYVVCLYKRGHCQKGAIKPLASRKAWLVNVVLSVDTPGRTVKLLFVILVPPNTHTHTLCTTPDVFVLGQLLSTYIKRGRRSI